MILCRNSSKPLRLYKSADKRGENQACLRSLEREQTRGEVSSEALQRLEIYAKTSV